MNQLIFYKKWLRIFQQRQEVDGSVVLYKEDQRELLDDALKIRLFQREKFNDN